MGGPRKSEMLLLVLLLPKPEYNMPTTRALLDRLACDKKLRRICGWEAEGREYQANQHFQGLSHEFAESQLPSYVHQTNDQADNLSEDIIKPRITGFDRDWGSGKATKATKADAESDEKKPNHKLGRPQKGEESIKRANEAGAPADYDPGGNARGFAA